MKRSGHLGLSAQSGDGLYIEPASRVQWVEKLIHLTRFSDFMLVLEGPLGSGKSTLLRQLRPSAGDNTFAVTELTLNTPTDLSELLSQLVATLPEHSRVVEDDRSRLQAIHSHGEALRNAGQRWLVMIDEAHQLTAGALDLLLNFIAASQGEGQPPQLLLAGDAGLGRMLDSSDLAASLSGRIHRLQLLPLSNEESHQYLKQKLPQLLQQPVKLQQKLIREAAGLPGELDRLANILIRTGKLASGRKPEPVELPTAAIPPTAAEARQTVETTPTVESAKAHHTPDRRSTERRPTRAFPLPPLQMTLIALVLFGITGLAAWQFFPESDGTGEPALADSAERVSLPLNLALDEGMDEEAGVGGERPAADPYQSSARRELEQRLRAYEERQKATRQPESSAPSEPEAVIVRQVEPTTPAAAAVEPATAKPAAPNKAVAPVAETAAASAEVAPGSKPAAASYETPDKPVVAAAKPAVPAAKSEPSATADLKLSASERELLSWPSRSYTLQMLGARAEKSARDFLADQADRSEFHYFSTIYKGKPWHVVVYGHYPSRDAANAALNKLPKALRQLKPWVRSVAGVQSDIRKKTQ
ncbi:SPOR domain-containing protein [Marinobacterium arenosum]|uniref:SPOR domain-containing protein n=1 Tax=Marinobacterium arenosum TaxID=2862496 RepID=UPI001C94CB59|nr:SPOR domain-containing protein [Marinobacterium arenosum]MBY4675583.1 SPOR domain-containing protein [Marinobacterium arenosum]